MFIMFFCFPCCWASSPALLLTCESTLGLCDKGLLTPSEAEKIAKIEKEQNYLNCQTGSGSCDYSLLTPAQTSEVKELQRERNLLACQTGEKRAISRY